MTCRKPLSRCLVLALVVALGACGSGDATGDGGDAIGADGDPTNGGMDAMAGMDTHHDGVTPSGDGAAIDDGQVGAGGGPFVDCLSLIHI